MVVDRLALPAPLLCSEGAGGARLGALAILLQELKSAATLLTKLTPLHLLTMRNKRLDRSIRVNGCFIRVSDCSIRESRPLLQELAKKYGEKGWGHGSLGYTIPSPTHKSHCIMIIAYINWATQEFLGRVLS